MSRGRLFGTLCSISFLVNLGRKGFAPLLEPVMTTFAVGPGTAGPAYTRVFQGLAGGLAVVVLTMDGRYLAGRTPGSPAR